MSSPRTVELGFDFAGTSRYQVLSRLGEGGMGIVYEVLDRERNARLALKTLATMDPDAILRFKNEFRALQDLNHPNLVNLGELHEEHGRFFFTMELVRGCDFLTWVRGQPQAYAATMRLDTPVAPMRRFDEGRLRSALAQLATGLEALHAADKVHRDIKPSNVMVTDDGRVVILDFGLVSDVGGGAETMVAGTLAFMAPEQASARAVGPAADWYSVGSLLYLAMTGKLAFDGIPDEVLEAKGTQLPPPPAEVAPGIPSDLNRLCVDLLRPDPAARPSGREVLARLGVSTEPARRSRLFIGRRRELAELEAAWAQARERPTVLLCHGESGIGKTMLVHEFTAQLKEAVVLSGRCSQRESVPYRALDEIVDGLSRHLARLPREEAAALVPADAWLLAQVFPVLGRVDAIASMHAPEGDTRDPLERRTAVFAGIRELFVRLRRKRSVVLVIDDLQWADSDGLGLLAEILRPPDAPALLVLATVRTGSEPAPGTRSMAELTGRIPCAVRHLAVERLSREDTRTLALALLPPGTAVDPETIASESGGHPLFADAIVRHRLERGEEAGALRLDDALWSRVGRLEPAARRIVELVAVAGGRITKSTAAQAVAMEGAELDRWIGQLAAQNLLRTEGRRDSDGIEPYHDRVREAVLSRLAEPARQAWHGRLALALEASGRADAEALAVHWRAAGNLERAAQFAVAAAEQAVAALAFARAAHLYRLALEIRPGERLLRIRLAEALVNAGRGAEAAEAYLAAANRAEPAEALDLRRRAAEQLLRSGHIDRGLDELRRVLTADGWRLAKTPRRALASLALRRAKIRLRGLRFRKRDAGDVPAADLARIDTCWSVSVGLGMVDHIRGSDFQSRNLLLALRAGEPYRLSRALSIEACYAATPGQSGQKRTDRIIHLASQLADELGHPHAQAWVTTARTVAAFCMGRWRAAYDWALAAETMYREQCAGIGVAWEISSLQTFIHQSLVWMGAYAELARRMPIRLREAEERGDLYGASSIRTFLFIPHLLGDDLATAHTLAETALRDWSQSGFYLQHCFQLSARLEIDIYLGHGAEACRRVQDGWRRVASSQLLQIEQAKLAFRFYRARSALLLAAQSQPSERARLLRAIEAECRRIAGTRASWAIPFAALFRAGVAFLRGDRDRALALLAEAEAGLEAADQGSYAAATRHQRGRLLGGDEGRALVARADAWMKAEGIAVPEKIAALFAPGFEPM